MKQAPHIGQMIKKNVKDRRLFQSVWARLQGIKPSTISAYLRNPTMRVDTLFTICQILNHNFFTEIAQQLPEMPPATQHESIQQLEALKQENEQLKLQVATLEKALGLVGGR